MISVLRIKNLALAENTTVEFGMGLNVITGETGAGKSILIGALGLLLGNRADKSIIRTGEEVCGAEALFILKDADGINELLAEYGVDPCEDGQLVLRRIIRAEGAGQNWVNGCPVTLQILKRIGDMLVDIHGPHDHQSLLQPETQLELLDAFGHLWKEREEYETQFEALRLIESRIGDLAGDEHEIADQIDRLAYRVKEIEEAGIQESEEEELMQEHTILGNAQRIRELGGEAVAGLTENDASAFNILAVCRQRINSMIGILPDAENWLEQADTIIRQVQELGLDMSRSLSDIMHNPDRLAWLDERLALYQRLKRKYGPEVHDVLKQLEQARNRLQDLETRGEQMAKLEKEKAACYDKLCSLGECLHEKRQTAAIEMSAAIQKELQTLGLKNSLFTIAFQAVEPHTSGMDVIEFEFAPNAGEDKRPLRQIASSGEMSRVMLATKTVLAAHDRIPVLVFDEIDSNVGGETAGAVGAKLKELAANHQVICITHFPQVAVFGRAHLAVEKQEKDGRTTSGVRLLMQEDRIEEIARMLGGRNLTSFTLDHAREMLETVQRDD